MLFPSILEKLAPGISSGGGFHCYLPGSDYADFEQYLGLPEAQSQVTASRRDKNVISKRFLNILKKLSGPGSDAPPGNAAGRKIAVQAGGGKDGAYSGPILAPRMLALQGPL